MTPWAEQKVRSRVNKSLTWRIHGISQDVFQVTAGRKNARVDMRDQTCTCNRWQKTGLPCGHAIVAIKSYNIEDCTPWVQNWFKTDTYRATYDKQIYPVGSPEEWERPGEVMTVKPPIMQKRQAGRPRNRDRIPSRGEGPIIKTCSRCKQTGHTRINCPTPLPARDMHTRSGHASGSGHLSDENEDFHTVDLNEPY